LKAFTQSFRRVAFCMRIDFINHETSDEKQVCPKVIDFECPCPRLFCTLLAVFHVL